MAVPAAAVARNACCSQAVIQCMRDEHALSVASSAQLGHAATEHAFEKEDGYQNQAFKVCVEPIARRSVKAQASYTWKQTT